MELLDADALSAQCGYEIAGVIGHADQPSHPVRGTDSRGDEVIAITRRNDPLDFEGSLDLQTVASRIINQTLQQQSAASLVRITVLSIPITGRPSPTGLSGQRN